MLAVQKNRVCNNASLIRHKKNKDLFFKKDAQEPKYNNPEIFLGVALRRAAYGKLKEFSWLEYRSLITNIAIELNRSGSGEITKINTSGFHALRLAIKSMLDYAAKENCETLVLYQDQYQD